MRLVLANPHTFEYGNLISGFVFHRRMVLKYDFFTEFYMRNRPEDVAFYIDGTRNSFNIDFAFGAMIFSYIELFVWMLANKINPLKMRVYFDIQKLDPKKDILLTFARSITNISTRKESKMVLHKFQGVVLVHLTHYFHKIEKLTEYISKIPHCVIVAENDLTNNTFFRQYFPDVDKVYQLPYAYSERFICYQEDFHLRLNKCMAVGTPCPAEGDAFSSFFGKGTILQPMRKILYDKHHEFADEIDSFIKEFLDARTLKKITPEDSFFTRLAKRWLPYVVLEKVMAMPQKSYFKFDIVKKYNQYRMFVCPEEIIGLPSVNVFEGMACGCAYIGIDHPMYQNLGMLPGIHYIAYKENDLEDLISQVRYYQSHPQELEKIAKQGYDLVRKNFNRQNIAQVFWNDLEKIESSFSVNNEIHFHCSFKKSS